MHTYAGTVSNAKDAMAEFFDLIARSGVLEYLSTQIQTVLNKFAELKANGTLDKWAKDISAAVTGTIDVLQTAADMMGKFGGTITRMLEAMAIKKVVDFGVGLTGLGAAGGTAAAGLVSAEVAAGAAGATAAKASIGVRALGAAMAFLKNAIPTMAILGVLDSLVEKFFAAKKAADAGDAAVKQMLSDPGTGEAAKSLKTVGDAAKQAGDDVGTIHPKADDLIHKFDDLRSKGDSAADAIGKIGKDFDLSTTPGIRDAATVLDKLLADGKITAAQFRDAWDAALKGVDLVGFEVRA
jgi:hypothetical protein